MNFAEQLYIIAVFHQGLTKFVCHDERGFVLHTQVTRQLQRRYAFDCIGKYSNRSEVGFKRKFVVGKYYARCDRECVIAVFASPLFANSDEVMSINKGTLHHPSHNALL
jgi:hypothetical protein